MTTKLRDDKIARALFFKDWSRSLSSRGSRQRRLEQDYIYDDIRMLLSIANAVEMLELNSLCFKVLHASLLRGNLLYFV